MNRKRRHGKLLFFLIGTLTLASCVTPPLGAQQTEAVTPSGFAFVDGIPYATGLHGPLLADLYLPASKGPHPAILFIHGGGWNSGKRTQLKKIAEPLASAGYVGVAIEYDLSIDGGRFPLPLMQSKEAVRWMRAHASEYGIDPNRIATIGSSAGGELSALVGLTIGRKDLEAGENLGLSSDVAAVAVLNGVLDLPDLGDASKMDTQYLGDVCSKLPGPCAAASPVDAVHPGAPPFYIGHGTKDLTVPYQQAQRFIQLLKDSGIPVTPFVADGAGHTYWGNDLWLQPNLFALKQFLVQAMPASLSH